MQHTNLIKLTTIAFLSTLLGATNLACTHRADDGHHPHSNVPENHAQVHKPKYLGGRIAYGELRELEPDDVPTTVTAVRIDRNITDVCDIEVAKAHFGYDSARIDEETEEMLAKVADCFRFGPLMGRELDIIGHTDPRGSDEYNEELGLDRAEAVAEVVREHGLHEEQLDVDSRGEDLAHEDPDKWPQDRRVDLRLDDDSTTTVVVGSK